MVRSQLSLLCLASLLLCVSCDSFTRDDAKSLVHKLGGIATGEAKERTSVDLRSAFQSATNDRQRSCLGRMSGDIFRNTARTVGENTRDLVFTTDRNWETLANSEKDVLTKAYQDHFNELVNTVVDGNRRAFQTCL